MMQEAGNRVKYFSFYDWNWPWLQHGFSTRQGGVSEGEFHSLNLARSTDDTRENVQENRHRWLKELKLYGHKLVMGEQVHRSNIRAVNFSSPALIPETDGLFTDEKIALMGLFADCLPLYFVVPSRLVIGLVHAGWRGTLLKIGPVSFKFLQELWGIMPSEVLVGLGPSIGSCCYEVGEDVVKDIEDRFLECIRFVDEAYYLDLPYLNKLQLLEAGIREENIYGSRMCTACLEEEFYSHRRDTGRTGRMAGVVALV